jgi:hypothetical protein
MLDKTIVISNLRRFFVRVSSNSNINVRNVGGAAAAADADDNDVGGAPICTNSRLRQIDLDPPNKVHFRGNGDDVVSGFGTDANISNVESSANLVFLEERQRKKNLRGRMRQVSERLSLTSAPTDLPLPAAHHRIQSCVGSWFNGLIRIPILLGLLYFFVCSLDFLSTAFRLIAGKTAGKWTCHIITLLSLYSSEACLSVCLSFHLSVCISFCISPVS